MDGKYDSSMIGRNPEHWLGQRICPTNKKFKRDCAMLYPV
jgi:hypothetical protein